MRVLLLLLCLFVASPVRAFPPVNQPVEIQPTERRDWACDFGVTVTTLVDHRVTLRSPTGGDAECTTDLGWGYDCGDSPDLITEPTVSGTLASFRITPAGKTSGNVYQVTIIVEDAGGQRFACDGKVTIQQVKVVL